MFLQQTVTIPADRRLRLDLPLPETFSSGVARVVLTITGIADETPRESATSLLSLRGSCKGLDTLDAYFERKRADKLIEEDHECGWHPEC